MRQITFVEPGRIEAWDLPEPSLDRADAALVRPLAVATCDVDPLIVSGALPLPGPFPLGHEGVAEVIAVGEDVARVRVGDRVSVAFSVACGACRACRRGLTSNCDGHGGPWAGGVGGFFGIGEGAKTWGGFLSDIVRVPYADRMLFPVPADRDPATLASVSDNLSDAWRAVGPQLAEETGAPVLVAGGAGSIGLYAAGIAVALGADRVDYVDDDPARLDRAAALGARVIEGWPERLGPYPVTVDASACEHGLGLAVRSTDVGGTCTSTGIYFEAPRVPLAELYFRSARFATSLAHVHTAIPPVIELIVSGRLRPELATMHTVPWDEAIDALTSLREKTVFTRAPAGA